ncbi:hypothetical protein Dimus_028826 [Dionaea muscipula]
MVLCISHLSDKADKIFFSANFSDEFFPANFFSDELFPTFRRTFFRRTFFRRTFFVELFPANFFLTKIVSTSIYRQRLEAQVPAKWSPAVIGREYYVQANDSRNGDGEKDYTYDKYTDWSLELDVFFFDVIVLVLGEGRRPCSRARATQAKPIAETPLKPPSALAAPPPKVIPLAHNPSGQNAHPKPTSTQPNHTHIIDNNSKRNWSKETDWTLPAPIPPDSGEI